ncbi:ATP-binding protein [Streptomyces antimycoticus]|uniref:ATP-binding protein n=2 Tax=Streptomyces antimycoticus TaxID=68175 RepID=UPI000A38B567|nr:ATP-binding protein [Streptomyces antimycoticus]
MVPVAGVDTQSRLSMSLTVQPSELGSIRRAVIRQLRTWGLEEIVDDAVLVVTELLANVHKHAEGVCDLEIEHEAGRLIVRVSDTVMTPPTVRPRSTSAEIGRGLHLVGELTEHWETAITGTGKVVTCRFRAVDRRRQERVALGGGHA